MRLPSALGLAAALVVAGCSTGVTGAPAQDSRTARTPRTDPCVARPRVVVMTDIANEPDDQMSLVRFLLYSNQFDVEGLVASTSTWMKNKARPDVIYSVLDA
jgi:Cellulose-binding Sde182, nucleoside hydrolase-like domain